MKTIYIHAGFHKTATTYIQQFLKQNQGALSPYLLYYLDEVYRETPYANHVLAACIRKAAHPEINIPEPREAVWQRFMETVQASPCDKVVVSSEVFMENADLAFLSNALATVKLTFIFYVRRQDEYCESIYAETIKHGNFHSVDEFYGNWKLRGLDYVSHIRRFQSAVPDAKIIVREFNRSLFPKGDIIRDFLAAIGVELKNSELEGLAKVGIINQRLSRAYLELMRQFNILPVEYSEKMAFRDFLLSLLEREPRLADLPPFRLEGQLRASILQVSSESNMQLVRDYLFDGDFFTEESIRKAAEGKNQGD